MRGLGDAIRCAESFIDNEPFAVLLGDDVIYNPEKPALKQMMEAFSRLGATMLGCQEVPQELVSRYGIVQGQPTDDDRVVKLIDMVEKPAVDEAPSRLAALGRYILTPDIFEILRRVQPGRAAKSSSPMPCASWPTGKRSTPIPSAAAATTRAINWASSKLLSNTPCAGKTWETPSGNTCVPAFPDREVAVRPERLR